MGKFIKIYFDIFLCCLLALVLCSCKSAYLSAKGTPVLLFSVHSDHWHIPLEGWPQDYLAYLIIHYQDAQGPQGEAEDFTGVWNRTNTIRAFSASVEIENQDNSKFDFTLYAQWAAHTGVIKGEALITAENEAYFYIEPNKYNNGGILIFTLQENILTVDYTGDIYALQFGHNVFPHGSYVQGEPYYTNAGIVEEVFPTEELPLKMQQLMGNTAYEQMIFVMEYGIPYEVEPYTYSGFINGIGIGVDFLINDDGYIYCLGYYLEGSGYTFYTNDPEYRDKLPDFMNISRTDYTLAFVFKDLN